MQQHGWTWRTLCYGEISQKKTNTIRFQAYVKSKEYNKLMKTTKKKETLRYREKASYPWLSMMGSGEYRGERQRDTTIGYKIGYKDVLPNMRNIANIL